MRVFDYLEAVDAFVVSDEYRGVAEELGLIEWNPVVWLGRLFMLDNDYGEHWFDNWDEREQAELRAKELGVVVDPEELMIVVPGRFQNGKDGPCHSEEIRKRFWTDVLKELDLSLELLFEEARHVKARELRLPADLAEPIADLEERIAQVRESCRE
jgi:hypothetical protein